MSPQGDKWVTKLGDSLGELPDTLKIKYFITHIGFLPYVIKSVTGFG